MIAARAITTGARAFILVAEDSLTITITVIMEATTVITAATTDCTARNCVRQKGACE